MHTLIQITLLALVLTPVVVVVYRIHRKIGDGERIPLIGIAESAIRGFSVPPRRGPDTDRIERELFALQFHHRDSA